MGNDGPDLHEAISFTKSASLAALAGQVAAAAQLILRRHQLSVRL
jgi:hypothetical protein